MHFVHISPEDLERTPWLGVLIGLLGMVLFTFVSYVAARDSLAFSKQGAPELIDVENMEVESLLTRRWATLTNFHLDCDRVEKTRRTDAIEKLVLGPVYDTYIPITNRSGEEVIIVIIHGDVSCPDFHDQLLSGVLTTTQDYSYGIGFLSTKLSGTSEAKLIMRIDEVLAQAWLLLIVGVLLDLAFLTIVVKYSRLWLEIRDTRPE